MDPDEAAAATDEAQLHRAAVADATHLPERIATEAACLPQELAPCERSRVAGCPGFKGPVPLPVSMGFRGLLCPLRRRLSIASYG
jgi:hypothetical protein